MAATEHPVPIAGVAVHLPDRQSMQCAIDTGQCTERDARRMGIESVCVAARDVDGPAMAVHAARDCLAVAHVDPGDVDLLVYVRNHDEGHVLWPVASYLQNELEACNSRVIELRQMSNGGLAALDVVIRAVRAGETVLLVASDTFKEPIFDRFSSDPGTVFADGAVATVFANGHEGIADILSLAHASAPELEILSRPQHRYGVDEQPVNFHAAQKSGIAEVGLGSVVDILEHNQIRVVDDALKLAGVTRDEISIFVLPNLGKPRLSAQLINPLGLTLESTMWNWGRTVGHLGAGDQLAGLHHAIDSGRLRPGELACLVGVGGGFTWSAAIVQLRGSG